MQRIIVECCLCVVQQEALLTVLLHASQHTVFLSCRFAARKHSEFLVFHLISLHFM